MKFLKFRNRYISSTTAQTKKITSIIFEKTLKGEIGVFRTCFKWPLFAIDISLHYTTGSKSTEMPYFTDYFWYLLIVCRQCRKLQIFTNNLTLVTDNCCKLWLIFTDAFAMSSDNYWNLWDELSFTQHWQHNISHYKILSVQMTLSVYLLEKV